MDWFNLCLDGITLFFLSILHIRFLCRLTDKQERSYQIGIYFLLLCILQLIAVAAFLSANLSILLQLLLLVGISHWLLKITPPLSFVASLLALYVSQLSFGMVNSLEAIFFPAFLGRPILSLLLLLAILVSFILCTCCYTLVLKLLTFREHKFRPYLWILLLPVLFFFCTELYILQTAYQDLPAASEALKHFLLLSLQALGLGALLCLLYAYWRLCSAFLAQASLHSLTQAANAQKTYIQEAKMRYEATRAFRHDIRNHLLVVNSLLHADKQQEAQEYLKKIDAAASSLSFPYHTGNPIVDTLLEEKLETARLHQIQTEVFLTLPNTDHIDDFDLCVIFSNALDNAIKACQSIEEHPYIFVTGERQGDFYRIEFKNICSSDPLPPIGTGLANIQAAAEKYHGTIMIEKTDNTFCLNVLLNIS